MNASPLLVWSWSSHGGSSWPAALRLRALAVGQALAVRAGYRVVFYGDAAALAELERFPWPWERRALPTRPVPPWFWSGTKLLALEHANEREHEGTPVVHIDHDALVWGPLAGLEGAPLYGDHEHAFSAHPQLYPLARMRAAFGDDAPDWWEALVSRGRASSCALVGGCDRVAVAMYCAEAIDRARDLDALETGERAFTWTLEQGTLQAIATVLACDVRHALDRQLRGPSFQTWPDENKRDMGPTLRKLADHVPPDLRAALDAALPPLPAPRSGGFPGLFA